MNEPGGAPWIDGAGTMRVGPPPAGWWQASDDRWYPPTPLGSGVGGRSGALGHGPSTLEARPYIDGPAADRRVPGRPPDSPVPGPVPVTMPVPHRAPYGDISVDRRRGGAYREPTPTEVVALLRSGEHRAVAGPPPPRLRPPVPSGEHRVTRAPLAGLVDGFRSWPLWVRVAAPMAGAVALLGAAGVFPGGEPVEHEAISTQNTAPPPTEVPSTTVLPVMPAPTMPPTSLPIETAPPVTDPPPPPATDPEPVVTPDPASAVDGRSDDAGGHVHYSNCDAARSAGATPVLRGDPGYGSHLDGDNDGTACE